MFRDADIISDNTDSRTHMLIMVAKTCSWLDYIAMSNVLSESTVDCRVLQDVACLDQCAITVTLNFDQLPRTHSIGGKKAKHIN